ncbi:MAG: GIY-YIG nuclease family protein [Bacteroidales bacterium]|nr:GIY-YIG nuclease family protein [Bacteroidales bacterium]
MYYVYILQSQKDGKFSIGSTSDVEARLAFHNPDFTFVTFINP